MHDGQNLFDDLYSFMGEWGVDESMEKIFQTNGASSIIVGIQTAGFTLLYIFNLVRVILFKFIIKIYR
jgi:hypothetical protein